MHLWRRRIEQKVHKCIVRIGHLEILCGVCGHMLRHHVRSEIRENRLLPILKEECKRRSATPHTGPTRAMF